MTTVLMVLSAARFWTLSDGTKHPTGFWAEEFVVPYETFRQAGWDVTVATPHGATPVVDDISLSVTGGGGLLGTINELKKKLAELQPILDHPVDLSDVDPDDFDLIFYPGGHGPMEDLAHDPVSGALLSKRITSDRPLALLCHAPAAILAATKDDETNPFAGRKMTGLSNAEEKLNSFGRKAPWLLEDELKRVGVDYSKGLIPLRSHIVIDGNLFTGQNPKSSKDLAEAIVERLSSSSPAR
ncbi:type 1 glutamine amidotransferase domain-containing protein [Bowdeniella massiliensis]|uniref:type 1 glutamine amidotransferase domain-containing protein n=1 Tax=Bowdeniella massiliensis TaxID=2932264 RepID=UPI002028A6FE|nr:type 1 glutamine amidotransferase domain-containing protein [Bowdeniella massiliensis]